MIFRARTATCPLLKPQYACSLLWAQSTWECTCLVMNLCPHLQGVLTQGGHGGAPASGAPAQARPRGLLLPHR